VDFLPGNALCCHVTVSGFEAGFVFGLAGDAEIQFTSWLLAGAEVSTPAQAASTVTQATAIKLRSIFTKKQCGDSVMGKQAADGYKTCFLRTCKQAPEREGQITQRGSDRKSFRIRLICTALIQIIKKAAPGFPEAAFRSS
jgi:hypothetical protein